MMIRSSFPVLTILWAVACRPAAASEATRPQAERAATSTSVAGSAPSTSSSHAPDATLPVRWTTQVDLHDVTEIPHKLAAVDPQGLVELGERGAQDVTPVTPRSCVEWEARKKQGYSARTTMDIGVDNAVMVKCRALKYLGDAWPSKTSHVATLTADMHLFDALPASMHMPFLEAGHDAEEKALGLRSWRSFDPKLKDISDPSDRASSRIRVAESDPDYPAAAWIGIQGYGDFDHDGVEDVLIDVRNYPIGGTLTIVRLVRMTRDRDGGVLRVIGVDP